MPLGDFDMAHDALRTILPIAGWPEERARAVEITGGADPVLPTPFRIGAAGAAALAATRPAAARFWGLGRAGPRPPRPSPPPGSLPPIYGSCAAGADKRSASICARRSPRCAAAITC